MKKRVFSVFLILTLILTALAGCASGGESPSKSSGNNEEVEQLLATGRYEVYDEDDELVGYLRVTGAKIVVFDEDGNEEGTLRYDYNEKKELYTLDGGRLFGCEEFTVEKSKKKLKLITEDDDEYILEEIDKIPTPENSESPAPGPSATVSGGDGPDVGYIRLPLGCYEVYGNSHFRYLKVTDRTMILYDDDGSVDAEDRYSYDRDGSCLVVEGGETITILFTYERGTYYMTEGLDFYRLEPVSESEIPVPGGPSPSDTYYIGGNGSIDLYAWLPDGLYGDLQTLGYDDGYLSEYARFYDGAGTDLRFEVVLASGEFLQEGIGEAQEEYAGTYSSTADLLYRVLRDDCIPYGVDDYTLNEGYTVVNGRNWRRCDVSYYDDEHFYESLLFWMEGDDMAVVLAGGSVEDADGYDVMIYTISNIIYSLELY